MHTKYEFILIKDAIQKLNIIRVRLKMTQKKRYQRIKTNVDTVVSILFPLDGCVTVPNYIFFIGTYYSTRLV
jgi:hypothetical protein